VTIPLTRDVLRACYDFLNECEPFNKWVLPDGDEVAFKVARGKSCWGWYEFKDSKHTIAVSSGMVGHTSSLVSTMAHEMIHLHERNARACKPGTEHSPAFKKWAAQVCAIHGFDPVNF
tara:strand:+ start:1564 stop:1917 length:354 start_codon:yes stop_codon:yes gene_type:complete